VPGKSLGVYEPAQGLVTDVFPCENGHAQERSLFGPLLNTVAAGDLWIEDRNFCTRDFLCDLDNRGAFFREDDRDPSSGMGRVLFDEPGRAGCHLA
jgi:hypothetical protein